MGGRCGEGASLEGRLRYGGAGDKSISLQLGLISLHLGLCTLCNCRFHVYGQRLWK